MWRRYGLLFALVAALAPHNGHAAKNATTDQAMLQADKFDYDEKAQQFVATGHVELDQDGQILTAQKMVYDRSRDEVTAQGDVVLVDKTGQVYFADSLKLEQKMKKGVVDKIGLVFPDGSRFAARQGEQVDDNKIVLRDGVYSPCNLCKENPQKAPIWQIRAKKIVHDKAARDVYYHNVTLDAYGVPVAYTPYFSHPDPDVVSRTGILMPQFSSDSKKGFMLRNYYYENISPSEDATIELSPTTKSGTVLGAEYRRMFDRGNFKFNGSINESEIRDSSGSVIKDERVRGHVFADGRYNLTPDWSAGFNVRRTFDDYYLRDFDYSSADVLINRAYVERIKGRDYSNIAATYFQDLRPNITQDQSDVLPYASHNVMGDANAFLGGRWDADNEFVTLFRNGDQSVSRLSTIPSWERRDILPYGLQSVVNTKLRADGYWVRQNSPFVSNASDPNLDKTVGRLFPSAQATLSYPLVRPSTSLTGLIEPKMALTVAPNNANNDSIPNEDSRDAQIDISNLFDDNRFPGADRIEDGSHFAYGVKAGGYYDNGNSAFATLGESYRLTDQNPFPDGSGLEDAHSDLVGQIEATFYNKFYTDYRFQLNQENLDDRRHELQATYVGDSFEARTNYVFAQVVEGTGLPADRQQIGFSAAKALSKKWSTSVDTLNDLTGEAGLLKAGLGVQYKNECLRASLRGERDLTDQLAGGSDSRVIFSLGLRNLGGYDTPLLANDPLYQPFGSASHL